MPTVKIKGAVEIERLRARAAELVDEAEQLIMSRLDGRGRALGAWSCERDELTAFVQSCITRIPRQMADSDFEAGVWTLLDRYARVMLIDPVRRPQTRRRVAKVVTPTFADKLLDAVPSTGGGFEAMNRSRGVDDVRAGDFAPWERGDGLL